MVFIIVKLWDKLKTWNKLMGLCQIMKSWVNLEKMF